MDREILDQLREMGVNRPIVAYRMIGNRRIEVHCLGDYEPKEYYLRGDKAVERSQAEEKEKAMERNQYSMTQLGKKAVKDLRVIAADLGINSKGLLKADLMNEIYIRSRTTITAGDEK